MGAEICKSRQQEILVGALRGTFVYLLMQMIETTTIKQIKHQTGKRKKVETVQGE